MKEENEKVLEVKNLCFSHYRASLCLKDVSFSLHKNDKVFLFGRKETGKSTLLKVISNFETSYFGYVVLEGKNIKAYCDSLTNLSLLLNKPVFFENKTIAYNIDYLCEVQNINKFSKEELDSLLCDWGISKTADTKVKKLTLLEKRKLSILRSALKKPRIMFVEDLFEDLEGDDFQEMLEVYKKLLSLNVTAIFEIESETYKRAQEFFVGLKNKALFLSMAMIDEFNSVSECVDSLKNIDYFEYVNKSSAACDLVKYGEKYYFEFAEDLKVEVPDVFCDKLDLLDLNEIENVLLFSDTKLNADNLSKEQVAEMHKRGEFFVCSSIDGRRLI